MLDQCQLLPSRCLPSWAYGPTSRLWQVALPTKHGHLVWEFEALPPDDNLSAGCHGVIRVEGRVPHHHLVHDGSHRPPVAFHAIPLLQQHLRSNVVWGAYGRVGLQRYRSSSSTAVQSRWRTAVKDAAALGSCSCQLGAQVSTCSRAMAHWLVLQMPICNSLQVATQVC